MPSSCDVSIADAKQLQDTELIKNVGFCSGGKISLIPLAEVHTFWCVCIAGILSDLVPRTPIGGTKFAPISELGLTQHNKN